MKRVTKLKSNKRAAGKEERRGRILAAAEQLLRKHGKAGLSTRTIGAKAGVSAMTAYNLIGSKADIVWSLMGLVLQEIQRDLSPRSFNTPDEVIGWLVGGSIGVLRKDPEYIRNLVSLRLTASSGHASILDQQIKPVTFSLAEMLQARGCLHTGVDPESFMLMINSVFHGNLYDWAYGGIDLEELEIRWGFCVSMAMAGLLVTEFQPESRARAKRYLNMLNAYRKSRTRESIA